MNLDIVKKFEELVQGVASACFSTEQRIANGKLGYKEFQPIILKLGGTRISEEDYVEFGRKTCGVWPGPQINIAGDFARFRGERAYWDEEFVFMKFSQQYGPLSYTRWPAGSDLPNNWRWLFFKIPSDMVMKVVVLGELPPDCLFQNNLVKD